MARITMDPQERRELIVKTSQDLFIRNGFLATKISDIVKSMSVSQGVFYYYFKSKDEVIDAIVESYISQLVESTVGVMSSKNLSPVQRLERMAELQLGINRVENNNIHSIKGVDIHEKILKRLTVDYIPLMQKAFREDQETLFLLEIFFLSGNILFDPGFFQWDREERNRRILFLIDFMERSLNVSKGDFSFYRKLMGYIE